MKKCIFLTALTCLLISLPVKAQIQTNCRTVEENTRCTTIAPTGPPTEGFIHIPPGGLIGVATRHAQDSFCKKNPGQNYKGHQCPTEYEGMVTALRTFILATPKFQQSDANVEILGAWIDSHNLDRTDVGSYKKAWNALKLTGQLAINK